MSFVRKIKSSLETRAKRSRVALQKQHSRSSLDTSIEKRRRANRGVGLGPARRGRRLRANDARAQRGGGSRARVSSRCSRVCPGGALLPRSCQKIGLSRPTTRANRKLLLLLPEYVFLSARAQFTFTRAVALAVHQAAPAALAAACAGLFFFLRVSSARTAVGAVATLRCWHSAM